MVKTLRRATQETNNELKDKQIDYFCKCLEGFKDENQPECELLFKKNKGHQLILVFAQLTISIVVFLFIRLCSRHLKSHETAVKNSMDNNIQLKQLRSYEDESGCYQKATQMATEIEVLGTERELIFETK